MPPQQPHPETLFASIERFASVIQETIETLQLDLAVAQSLLANLTTGENLQAVIAKLDMHTVRERLTAALVELETAGSHARTKYFASSNAKGTASARSLASGASHANSHHEPSAT